MGEMRLSDEKLALLAASGDSRAMEALAERAYPPVMAFCRKLTGNPHEAQDLAQAVMLRMIERLGQYRANGAAFTSWLFSVAYHLFIDGVRRKRPRYESEEILAALPDPADAYGAIDAGEQANLLLGALPHELRAMVTLRYYMDLSYDDIARIMDTSAKRVKWRLNDALTRMRNTERRLSAGKEAGHERV